MLILKENEECPHSSKCPHSNNCYGTRGNRSNKFTCSFYKRDNDFSENRFRNPQDITGKMKIINEGKT